ncbi:MAG: hypothetical protein F6K17_06690 [Okeania sp. SIO3C4]|nr:hypothetical protein [Okeania sp. SIO3B3]NER02339.1 hypothetical protein [Okeania sp. SIO3C4]
MTFVRGNGHSPLRLLTSVKRYNYTKPLDKAKLASSDRIRFSGHSVKGQLATELLSRK